MTTVWADETIETPELTALEMGDRDDDDYDTWVENRIEDQRDPFDIIYWDAVDAEVLESLSRVGWITKNLFVEDDEQAEGKKVSPAVARIGLLGFLQTLYSVMVYRTYVKDAADESAYYFAWFFVFIAHFILWFPVLLLWPLAYIGSESSVNWFISSSNMTLLLTLFFAYPVGSGLLVWASFIKSDNGDLEGGAAVRFLAYLVVTFITGFIHIRN